MDGHPDIARNNTHHPQTHNPTVPIPQSHNPTPHTRIGLSGFRCFPGEGPMQPMEALVRTGTDAGSAKALRQQRVLGGRGDSGLEFSAGQLP